MGLINSTKGPTLGGTLEDLKGTDLASCCLGSPAMVPFTYHLFSRFAAPSILGLYHSPSTIQSLCNVMPTVGSRMQAVYCPEDLEGLALVIEIENLSETWRCQGPLLCLAIQVRREVSVPFFRGLELYGPR